MDGLYISRSAEAIPLLASGIAKKATVEGEKMIKYECWIVQLFANEFKRKFRVKC